MSQTARLLVEMYDAMLARQGHQKWWPGDTPLEVCVGAILTQNTSWRNVKLAIDNLKRENLLSVEALHKTPPQRLADLIRPAGYFNVKTKRLRNFIEKVHRDFGGDIDAFLSPGRSVQSLREDLLSVNGIGKETADSMVLYGAKKLTFVVDSYTYRVLLRHGLIAPGDDYETIKELFEASLPADIGLFNDYHAQLVAVGKTFCRPQARCSGCPLESFPHDPLAGMEEY